MLMLMMSWISSAHCKEFTVPFTVGNLQGSFSRTEILSLWANSRLYRNKALLTVEKDRIRECLSKLDIHKSMRWDGINPRLLRELTNVIVRLLSVIFERSQWSGEVPDDLKKARITPFFKKEYIGNYKIVSLTTVSEMVIEQILLEAISKNTKNKKVTGNSQHGFIKGKLCLTNLMGFMMRGEQCMLFTLAFARPSTHSALAVLSLHPYSEMHNWVESWLGCWAERIGISDMMFSWQHVIRGFP